ncbi:hypothetical protein K7432_007056 [Basidiobolus ranarum]|uniref:Uncharacterized protein n=1 Tax=Basidiobolus ranarum TaxID=34480 RepID=A0ABR2WU05_9FUNG
MNCICFQRSMPGGNDSSWSPRFKKSKQCKDISNATAQGTMNTHKLKSFIVTLKNISTPARCCTNPPQTLENRPNPNEYISLSNYQIPEMDFEKSHRRPSSPPSRGIFDFLFTTTEDYIQMENYDELICFGSTC